MPKSAVTLGRNTHFANVIDAFHIVGSSPVHHLFYIDERRRHRGIRITDEFSQMLAGSQTLNLNQEVDARWRLVETAWNLGVAPNLLAVHHDASLNELFALDATQRRKAVTSSRQALNGYQKGRCFYCKAELQLAGTGMNVDVDHFFPHCLKGNRPELNLDGVWNLVLACADCNRGPEGKFDRIPAVHLLQRLHKRNEFLIGSHHPLRETLMMQTGATETARVAFLKNLYDRVQLSPNLAWCPRI